MLDFRLITADSTITNITTELLLYIAHRDVMLDFRLITADSTITNITTELLLYSSTQKLYL